MPTSTVTPTVAPTFTPTPASFLSAYAFPVEPYLARKYLFYLHGKIIEDQGIPADNPDDDEYQYAAILEKLNSYSFVVVSEKSSKNADGFAYAKRVA